MAKQLLLFAAISAVALAVPLDERQSCQAAWQQCGGINYSGATCCQSGNTCTYINDYYSQCIPGTATTTTTKSTTSTTSRTSTSVTSTTTTTGGTTTTHTTPPAGSGTATYSGNPFEGVQMWANAYYSSEVMNLAVPSLTGAMATAAAKVANVPSFMWLDTHAKVPLAADTLADIRKANQAGANPPYAGIFVVYDLPDRDCAAAASNGEYSVANGGVANYKSYIDDIKKVLVEYSDIRVLLVIEPDSLANLVTNTNVAKCSNAASAYHECINYALQQLNLANVAMYLDAGHAGWLGWPANISPAAQLFGSVYQAAGSPSQVRGLATNVANYNGWNLTTAPSYTQGDNNYDEQLYIQALAPLLQAQNFPAHFITDQSRSGKQPTGQSQWGDWCNAIGTGFGIRPTSNTNNALLDAFVWVKPGGECDGTSNSSASRYDYHCGLSDALQPSPEAGTWFQAYFVQLLTNANPAF